MRGATLAILLVLAVALAHLHGVLYPAAPSAAELGCVADCRWGESTLPLTRFTVPAGDAVDLRLRLDLFLNGTAPALPVLDDVADASFGIRRDRITAMVKHWRHKYDWPARLAALNALPHFKVAVRGLDVHFVHLQRRNARVVLLLHGWPGCFTEMLGTARLLHARGYDVVVPSLPSFGFSDAPTRKGFSFVDAACVLRDLLRDKLGVDPARVMCQGGDYGAFVCGALGQMEPALRLHLNFFPVLLPPLSAGSLLAWPLMQLAPFLYSADTMQRFAPSPLGYVLRMAADQTGYFHAQVSSPDTLGVGLMDSPAFLLAWVGEKFAIWSDSEDAIALDDVLDVVVTYWTSKSSTSSVRWYREMVHSTTALRSLLSALPNDAWVLDAPVELFRPPRAWLAHRMPRLRRFRVRCSSRAVRGGARGARWGVKTDARRQSVDAGGHFLALQLPAVVADDVHSAWEEAA